MWGDGVVGGDVRGEGLEGVGEHVGGWMPFSGRFVVQTFAHVVRIFDSGIEVVKAVVIGLSALCC